MGPLVICLIVCGCIAAACWLLSILTHEHSWVDRIWSIAPVAYVWIFAASTGLADARLVLMAVLVTLWGARLTFNFARKGGYAPGGEDYRWGYLRDRMPRWGFPLFNVFFIAAYQNALILLICLPALTVVEAVPSPLGLADVLVALLFLALLVGETIADEQQWRFHQAKAARAAAGGASEPRFLTTGLFRYSRHPNFFFEQAQWWAFYLFAVTATGAWLHPTIAGAVLLTALFIGSTWMTEKISRERYPEYADYQRTTSAIVPLPPRAVAVRVTN
ncbi:DUF1295 domain-containing protein [Agromyces atrinae]|uniref:DUF1295 domain-containing protein n=1 Tax=Agromyces atrinae TaxID=592376 RepID=UPI001F56B7CF|nr:DUF1295 domain-containing protein [Agromyces atrinae]MCI2958852.1 DUF1295 domain-containing protein [Agromyces atrinae]